MDVPKGRPKGVPNKLTRHGRMAIEHVFERIGGTQRLIEWVKEDPQNERDFYTKIWPRVIPQKIEADVNHTVTLPDYLADFWRARAPRKVG